MGQYTRRGPPHGSPQRLRYGKSWKERPNILGPPDLSTPVESRVERGKSPAKGLFLPWLWPRKSSLNPSSGRCYCRRRPTQPKELTGGVDHPNDLTAESLWGDVAARLRGSLNEKTYRNWFNEVSAVGLDADTFVLVGAERLHPGMDREPVRRPDPCRREGRHRLRPAARFRRAALGAHPLRLSRRPSCRASTVPRRSTRSTRSTRSSSARPTGSPTPPRSQSQKRRRRPTTRCSSTATRGSARRISCMPSRTTSGSIPRP